MPNEMTQDGNSATPVPSGITDTLPPDCTPGPTPEPYDPLPTDATTVKVAKALRVDIDRDYQHISELRVYRGQLQDRLNFIINIAEEMAKSAPGLPVGINAQMIANVARQCSQL